MSLDSAINNLVSRLETITSRLEKVEKTLASGGGASTSSSASASSDAGSSASVTEYQQLIDDFIRPFVDVSNKLGGEVAEQVNLILAKVSLDFHSHQIASNIFLRKFSII